MPTSLLLPPDQARVHWLIPEGLEGDLRLKRWWMWLSDQERGQAERFHFDRDRHTYVVAHALTRWCLSQCVREGAPGSRPGDWRFEVGEYGRPEIAAPGEFSPAGEEPLRFNLSHTRGLVACIVVPRVDCGVDVEFHRERVDFLGVARRVFSPRELEGLMALPEAERPRRFYQLWTLKEAYIKGSGFGMHLPLQEITFDVPEAASATAGGGNGPQPDSPEPDSEAFGSVGRGPTVQLGSVIEDSGAHWRFQVASGGPWGPSVSLATAIRIGPEAVADLPQRIGPDAPQGPARTPAGSPPGGAIRVRVLRTLPG